MKSPASALVVLLCLLAAACSKREAPDAGGTAVAVSQPAAAEDPVAEDPVAEDPAAKDPAAKDPAAKGAAPERASTEHAAAQPTALRSSDSVLSGERCGDLGCRRYATAASAIQDLMRLQPQMLAFGEAHALKGTEQVPTATERFGRDLLPELASAGAHSLVVELLKPASGCAQSVEQTRKTERQVTAPQDDKNKDRFVELGVRSRALGVVPFLLEPDCAEFESIAAAKENGVLRMLELIALKTEQKMYSLWQRRPPKGKSQLVLAYGGAMHNDILPPLKEPGAVDTDDSSQLTPAEVKAAFTFGRQLVEATNDRYLAVDLIVPEYIKDTETWKALRWYAHFDRHQPRRDATLFQTGLRSYVLIFPHTQTRNGR